MTQDSGWERSAVDDPPGRRYCDICHKGLYLLADIENEAHRGCIDDFNAGYRGPDASSGEYLEGSGSSNFGNRNGNSDAAW